MRVDRGDGGVHHLEAAVRPGGAEHRREHARQRKGRLGIAHRRRAAEDEDPAGARGFGRRQAHRLRPADERLGKIGRGAPAVFPPDRFAAGQARAAEEVRRVAETRQPQAGLESAEEQGRPGRGQDGGEGQLARQ